MFFVPNTGNRSIILGVCTDAGHFVNDTNPEGRDRFQDFFESADNDNSDEVPDPIISPKSLHTLSPTHERYQNSIPWSGEKWCYSLEYTDRSTVTRLGTEAEDDGFFMPSSRFLYQTRVSL